MLLLRDFKQSLFFGVKMHITMLIKNAQDKTIQCVIDDSNKKDFEAMGFVDNDAKLKPKPRARTIKAKTDA
tara:strand:+ start:2275 stop:2487 length:213 start_codon:yes stop_codon:yes gene_type:complete